MTFIWPTLLVLLVLIPIGVTVFVTLERRRRRRMAGYGMLTRLAGEGGAGRGAAAGSTATGAGTPGRSAAAARWRRRVPAACLVLGLTLVVFAIARPQAVVSVPRVEGTVILDFDVSNSMAATDIAPTRMEAAKTAADQGVRIDTVGIGTAAGATLDLNGFRVHTQLDEDALKQIADTTGGTYYQASDPTSLDAVYQGVQTRLVIRPEPMEVTSLFAGAGLLVLLVGGAASLFWLGRAP